MSVIIDHKQIRSYNEEAIGSHALGHPDYVTFFVPSRDRLTVRNGNFYSAVLSQSHADDKKQSACHIPH